MKFRFDEINHRRINRNAFDQKSTIAIFEYPNSLCHLENFYLECEFNLTGALICHFIVSGQKIALILLVNKSLVWRDTGIIRNKWRIVFYYPIFPTI